MNPVQIALLVTLAVILLAVIVAIIARSGNRSTSSDMAPEVAAMVEDARHDPGERAASLAAEQVESVVQRQIGDYLKRSQIKLDFGDLPDGGLGIWLNDTQYASIEDIPDQTIRDAIRAAVEEFNR